MSNTNEQIGYLIAQIRQEKGLTQAEFARRLSTSQSAVNRIEHGHQNLSLETLGRISEVLNKKLKSKRQKTRRWRFCAPACSIKVQPA
jgi:UDP-N-acetylglucosamine 1-carboxyvinyltransferase